MPSSYVAQLAILAPVVYCVVTDNLNLLILNTL